MRIRSLFLVVPVAPVALAVGARPRFLVASPVHGSGLHECRRQTSRSTSGSDGDPTCTHYPVHFRPRIE
jgi:hypothetical protein